MKKIIVVLLFVQMIVFSSYFITFYNQYAKNNLLYSDHSALLMTINNSEEFNSFISIIQNKGLNVSRIIYPNEDEVFIYSTDITLNGHINLIRGDWPVSHAGGFVSTIDSSESSQVGLVKSPLNNFQISLRKIDRLNSAAYHGIY